MDTPERLEQWAEKIKEYGSDLALTEQLLDKTLAAARRWEKVKKLFRHIKGRWVWNHPEPFEDDTIEAAVDRLGEET